ncbi:HNH endonuclease signature motif containing protein [Serinibacter arcticus]|uniref:HNH nuclease domain-containing protein n=1 Tax=Serinibacter arcticus TaxID=1655435 RepID=A0A4Z1E0W2_9MICO|nr:HNH endonuclease signature motif containing protein [Serinibacter arcticus]TGO05476.1 hypothetical protein SERN_1480 [Serinibacter arcticus]
MFERDAAAWDLGVEVEDPALVRRRLGLVDAEGGGVSDALLRCLLQLSEYARLRSLDDHELVETVAALAAVQGWAAAAQRDAAAALDARQSRLGPRSRRPGSVEVTGSAADSLAMRLGISRRRASRLVGEGQLYQDVLHPVGTALAEGRIDAGKATVFADLLVEQPPEVCFAVCEQVLPDAPGLAHQALRARVQAVIVQVDPRQASERAEAAARTRRLEPVRLLPDGLASLRLVAPLMDVVTVHSMAEAAARAARASGDARTLDQLRADAVVSVAAGALVAGRIDVGGDAPARRTEVTAPSPVPKPPTVVAGSPATVSPLTVVRREMNDLLRRRRRGPRSSVAPPGGPSLARTVLDPTAGPPPRFAPFSGTTARLTLAIRPDDVPTDDDQPCAADVYAWEFSASVLRDGFENPYAAFEPPDRCRLGVDVPALLGFGPLAPGTARVLAAAPPPYLSVVVGEVERATERGSRSAPGAAGTANAGPSHAHPAGAHRERISGYVPGARLAREVRRAHPTCVAPSCSVPASACDLDHVVPWPAGPTSADNLRPLCRHHHLIKTHLDHDLWLAPDGTAVWRTPEGHVYRRPVGGESRLDQQVHVRSGAA